MTLYLDTSLIIGVLTREPGSPVFQAWLARRSGFVISEWVLTELSSALSVKQRCGTISAAERHQALLAGRGIAAAAQAVLPVATADFRRAAAIADDPGVGLRSGDALHLAVVAAHGLGLATLDNAFAAAAVSLGFLVVDRSAILADASP